jgi:Ser/Thr protein kinase RdoA (MazF antagonist)
MAPAIETLQVALASALGRWDFSLRATINFLSHSENTTFLASDPETERDLVLRVHRLDYHMRAEILSEFAWISALVADPVVDTPGPIADREGNLLCELPASGLTRNVVAFERMSGHEPDQSASLPTWFRKLGELCARLHWHSRRWSRARTFERKTWDFDAMLGKRPLWGDWRAGMGLQDSGTRLLRQVADRLAERLHAYGVESHRFGLVHADLRLANLLVEGDRLGIIDFDDCGFSWFFNDFAAAASFIEHQSIVPELQAAWIEGYREVAAVSKEDEAMLPVSVMLRRMLLTGPGSPRIPKPIQREHSEQATRMEQSRWEINFFEPDVRAARPRTERVFLELYCCCSSIPETRNRCASGAGDPTWFGQACALFPRDFFA